MVYMFLADGFEETEALAPLDILRRGGVEVKTVGVTGGYVTGAHGITVKADILPPIALKDNTEAVILPGGGVGTQNLDASVLVKEAVQSAYSRGKLICAICAAPSVLGKMGLLRGKKAWARRWILALPCLQGCAAPIRQKKLNGRYSIKVRYGTGIFGIAYTEAQ